MHTILFSGGLDSTTLAYDVLANTSNNEAVLLLSFFYGSKHNKKENEQARKIFEKIKEDFPGRNIKLKEINMDFNQMGINSGLLTSSNENIPDGHYEDESMKKTVVPFRNGILLSIATGIAEKGALYYGCHAGDHAIYPDCREDFVKAMQQTIIFGTDYQVILRTPFVNYTKRDIGILAKKLNVPIEMTWSCYKGNDFHCGVCGTCTERIEALGGFDSTIYKE